MTRQRQVFPRDTVAHLWAHRAQDSARDASGNFYFTGPALYSYGSHFCIAYILGAECGPDFAGRVLWNDASYSNTTSKMQSIARQALTRQQWENALHMPGVIGMGRNVDPYRIERALQEKRLPDITPSILAHVAACVAELRGKRYGSGPFEHLLHEARKAETLARAFYARAGRKYPLPLMETRPVSSDKAQWAEWIRSISIGKMRKDYAEALAEVKSYAEKAEKNAADCGPGFPYVMYGEEWQARNVVQSTYDVAQRATRAIEKARGLYQSIHDKAGPASLKKTAARMAELAEIFAARRDEFNRRETQNRVIYDIREALKHVCATRAGKKTAYFSRRYWADLETLAKRASEAGMTAKTDPLYYPLAVRLSRIGTAETARDTLKRAAESLEIAQSYVPQFLGDAIRHGTEAVTRLQFIARLHIASGFYALLTPEIERIQSAAIALVNNAKAQVIARNAETLRAWLSGESDKRPSYDAGTFARIKGDTIETTRGAFVPVSHACRLSRLYAVIVKRGGQEWADGSGPIVGHYRVNRIGADGSLIIGCHEFSAEEAKRLHALLQDCAECQKETAEAAE